MSDKPIDEPPPTWRINERELLILMWVLAGVACGLYAARIAVRLSFFRSLFLDDGFASLALVILLAHDIVTTVMSPRMYSLLSVQTGRKEATADFPAEVAFFMKLQASATLLFWTCLWTVKACFLAFFYKMTEGLRPQRIMLWVVVGITVLSYIGAVITYPVSCSEFTMGACETQLHIDRALISIRYSTAVDVLTDLMIMAIPVWLCWQVHISWKQKLGLYAVLCIGFVIIVFSLIRVIVVGGEDLRPEPTWLATWSAIEASVAVIVASLSSFKAILTNRTRQKTGSSSYNRQYIQHGNGTDARSERSRGEYRAKSHPDSEEEHELRSYAGARLTSNAAGGNDRKVARVSEVSIEMPDLREASFESEARIWRGGQ